MHKACMNVHRRFHPEPGNVTSVNHKTKPRTVYVVLALTYLHMVQVSKHLEKSCSSQYNMTLKCAELLLLKLFANYHISIE